MKKRSLALVGILLLLLVLAFTSQAESGSLVPSAVPTHKLTIWYLFADGSEAAPVYEKSFKEGAKYSVTSPEVEDFTPSKKKVEGKMGAEDVTEHVIYQRAYKVTVKVNNKAYGTASADPKSGPSGTEVQLTATPEEGCLFTGWEVVDGDVTIDEENTFTIGSKDVEIKAHFERVYTVTLDVNNEKYGTLSADLLFGPKDTEVTLTVTPNDGYALAGWTMEPEDLEILEKNGEYTFIIGTEDVRVQADFGKLYTVTVVSNEHGAAEADVESGLTGTRVNLIADPEEGYRLKEWEVKLGDVTVEEGVDEHGDPRYSFTIGEKNVRIKAVFEKIPTHYLTINYVYEFDGSKAANAKLLVLAEGEEYEIDAPERAGYTPNPDPVADMMGTEDQVKVVTYAARVTKSNVVYTLNHEKAEAVVLELAKENLTKLTIPGTVTYNGRTYQVTGIADSACRGKAKLKQLTIGANVVRIGRNAFRNCTQLSTIILKTAQLTENTVGANAFRNVAPGAKVKCPKKVLEPYAEFLKKKGLTDATFEPAK